MGRSIGDNIKENKYSIRNDRKPTKSVVSKTKLRKYDGVMSMERSRDQEQNNWKKKCTSWLMDEKKRVSINKEQGSDKQMKRIFFILNEDIPREAIDSREVQRK